MPEHHDPVLGLCLSLPRMVFQYSPIQMKLLRPLRYHTHRLCRIAVFNHPSLSVSLSTFSRKHHHHLIATFSLFTDVGYQLQLHITVRPGLCLRLWWRRRPLVGVSSISPSFATVLYYCACCSEVTVTSIEAPRLYRIAVFQYKPSSSLSLSLSLSLLSLCLSVSLLSVCLLSVSLLSVCLSVCLSLTLPLPLPLSLSLSLSAWTAPEISMGLSPDHYASDIYSLGVVLWENVTRRMPRQGNNITDIISAVGFGKERPQVPEDGSACQRTADADSHFRLLAPRTSSAKGVACTRS